MTGREDLPKNAHVARLVVAGGNEVEVLCGGVGQCLDAALLQLPLLGLESSPGRSRAGLCRLGREEEI